ncbi:hypothetical protein, partial [Mesorhizobium sp. M2D.F.Ca.ET.171.01.1.1]|uniref:hypothetical protein n=1 Tax=Mesorhizobium sp. M2D.F.Ca.ET.171.01.1.1 TaxID=2563936 RepID=UPI00109288F8
MKREGFSLRSKNRSPGSMMTLREAAASARPRSPRPDRRPTGAGRAWHAAAALERDTMRGYEDFLAAYPHDRMAKRVRAIIAARR